MRPKIFIDMDEQEKAFIFACVEDKVEAEAEQQKKLERQKAKGKGRR